MRSLPILFNGEMVSAVLEGRKTQTRRVIKDITPNSFIHYEDHPIEMVDGIPRYSVFQDEPDFAEHVLKCYRCPYGQPGDYLWVRESFYCWGHWEKTLSLRGSKLKWRFYDETDDQHPVIYAQEKQPDQKPADRSHLGYHKRPSIFMPRAYSRIQLEVTDVRVERVQEISEADAIAEGIPPVSLHRLDCSSIPPSSHFRKLWDSINSNRQDKAGNRLPYSWADNPWVWVVQFKAMKGGAS